MPKETEPSRGIMEQIRDKGTHTAYNPGILNTKTTTEEPESPFYYLWHGHAEPSKRSINIEPKDRGYVVTVGCQTIAVSTTKKLLKYLTKYLKDPQGTEELYNANKFIK